ncbi:type III pantothenate kinase [Aurantivibrio plasticivorans]
MILDLDAGNTRLKWRLQGPGNVQAGACLYADMAESLSGLGEIRRVRVGCVAGADRLNEISALSSKNWGCEVEVAKVQPLCAGVEQGYVEPAKLGVDRWLAVLAAYNESRSCCVVVSCGTAITVDLVDAQGIHLGGYIVPGFELMRQALFSGTHAVQVPPAAEIAELKPGATTLEAVSQGCLQMVLGLVSSAKSQLGDTHVTTFLSGGDASKVLPHLNSDGVLLREQLVLDGLAYALP